MSEETNSTRDALVNLERVRKFATSPEMSKLEILLQKKHATIEEIASLLPIELLHVAMQLTVPPEGFRLPDFWPAQVKSEYQKAAIEYSDRFSSLKRHPGVRFYFASLAQKARKEREEENTVFKIEQDVFKTIGSVWDHEFWLEREGKLSPMCRLSIQSRDKELLLESTCDLQDLTFLARRILQMIEEGLERSIPWFDRGLAEIDYKEDVSENIEEIEALVFAIKKHARKLNIPSETDSQKSSYAQDF